MSAWGAEGLRVRYLVDRLHTDWFECTPQPRPDGVRISAKGQIKVGIGHCYGDDDEGMPTDPPPPACKYGAVVASANLGTGDGASASVPAVPAPCGLGSVARSPEMPLLDDIVRRAG